MSLINASFDDPLDQGERWVGYRHLIERYSPRLTVQMRRFALVCEHISRPKLAHDQRRDSKSDIYEPHRYPMGYWPGERRSDQLSFALKYEGADLGLLVALFEMIDPDELTEWIRETPLGKYARRIWFFYEHLTGERLSSPDLKRGGYLLALAPKHHYTLSSGERSQRHRIVNNLLGPPGLCPVVRRRPLIDEALKVDWRARCEALTSDYPAELLCP